MLQVETILLILLTSRQVATTVDFCNLILLRTSLEDLTVLRMLQLLYIQICIKRERINLDLITEGRLLTGGGADLPALVLIQWVGNYVPVISNCSFPNSIQCSQQLQVGPLLPQSYDITQGGMNFAFSLNANTDTPTTLTFTVYSSLTRFSTFPQFNPMLSTTSSRTFTSSILRYHPRRNEFRFFPQC
eukprot:TRINITY_DN27011_c0_g1_i1.p1 TRINITY_DN27011_c0_g1~~TRINITY_DN27011_c0_g1_i1.p1  ORF type:complete len:188 (+),score=5.85 TRINITY_DN27011_c0_g1_i1:119-682(+)